MYKPHKYYKIGKKKKENKKFILSPSQSQVYHHLPSSNTNSNYS